MSYIPPYPQFSPFKLTEENHFRFSCYLYKQFQLVHEWPRIKEALKKDWLHGSVIPGYESRDEITLKSGFPIGWRQCNFASAIAELDAITTAGLDEEVRQIRHSWFCSPPPAPAAAPANKKVIAQCTRTSADVKWLHRLLCDLGLAGWLKRNHEAGMTVNHTRTLLLRSEKGQLELRILAEMAPVQENQPPTA